MKPIDESDCAEWAHCSGSCQDIFGVCPCPQACLAQPESPEDSAFQRWVDLHPWIVAMACTGAAWFLVLMST